MKSILKGCAVASFGVALAVTAPASAQVVGTPGAPSAFGLAGGVGAASITGTYGPRRGPNLTRFDASTALTFGFGDPVDGLGVQVGANLTSFRKFGKSGFLTLGVHKMFQASDAGIYSVGVNVENIAPWGDAKRNKVSGNVVVSYMTSFGDKLGLITVGATNTTPGRKVEPILAVGMGLTDTSSVSLSQVGDRTTLGTTFAVSALSGASVNLSAARDWKTKQNFFVVDVTTAFNFMGN